MKNSDATSWHELLHLFGPFCNEFRKATKRSQMPSNITKHNKNVSLGSNGVDLVRSLQKKSNATSWHELLDSFGPFCTEFRKATKLSKMHSNSTKRTKTYVWGSNGMDPVRSLRKIPTRLRGTNFCTSSAHFAPSFVRQTNSPECT